MVGNICFDSSTYMGNTISQFIVGGSFGIYILTRILKIKDSIIGMASCVLDFVAEILRSIVWAPWVMYLRKYYTHLT